MRHSSASTSRSSGRAASTPVISSPSPAPRASLETLVANVNVAVDCLPVPLALEPIASLFEWASPEIAEADFITELLDRTGALLLLDVANVYANARNHGFDPVALLERLPLERLGLRSRRGRSRTGRPLPRHPRPPVPSPVLDLLREVAARASIPGVMLERDNRFPPTAELNAELDAIAAGAGLGGPMPVHAGPPRRRGTDAPDPQVRGAQAHLVRALVAGGRAPAGFDTANLEAASRALAAKRARATRS